MEGSHPGLFLPVRDMFIHAVVQCTARTVLYVGVKWEDWRHKPTNWEAPTSVIIRMNV